MAGEIELTYVITSAILGASAAIIAFWLSRRLSLKIEERVAKERDLKTMVSSLMDDKERLEMINERANAQINSLKIGLRERDEKIADLKGRIKTSEELVKRLEQDEKIMAELKELLEGFGREEKEKKREKK